MYNLEPVCYNPGIPGFVKAHKHPSGPALVMSCWSHVAAVYWVKRLHHAATAIDCHIFRLISKKTLQAVERAYEIAATYGPPYEAYPATPDYQRKRVYRWEEDNIFPVDNEQRTFDQCQRFLNKVWKKVGDGPAPALEKSTRLSRAMAYSDRILLPISDETAWTKPVMLHEISHILEFPYQHGPRFVSRYMDLCVEFLGLEPELLESSAERYGVLFA